MPLSDRDKRDIIGRYKLQRHGCDCGFSGTILEWKFQNAARELVLFEQMTLREARAATGPDSEMYCPRCGLPYMEQ